ncbi:glycosyl transferase family 90-domain-containing protein [Mycena alexandri]|uniref:Glycosyl transferase family 90-domain-containing protein n=1 Tax=Mycena alexandri TaxID=1745969 RepID=A0AAD6T6C6_9AGAR|nr:glycosyl transferase family 90-domain-containing protein [Mycena alexandri]
MITRRKERGLRFILGAVAVFLATLYLRNLLMPAETFTAAADSEDDHPQLTQAWVSPPAPIIAEHLFRDDGLLEVDPRGIHPIFELIRRAEDAWAAKLKRASTTLPRAVAEYRRRYRRDPPNGFDDWWRYVQKHAVQLPDEYDQIHADLEPFWGIEPTDLFKVRAQLEAKVDSYTLGKTSDGMVDVVNASFAPGKYDQLIKGSENIIDLLSDVEEFLPDFRAVFSPHDGPNRLSDYFVENAARQAAAEKRYVRRKDLPKINPVGWISACSPESPGRNKSIDLNGEPPEKTTKKTFIHDHNLATNPCLHPRHFWHHGHFLSYGKGPNPERDMVPEFSYCSSNIHHNIRIPTPYGWVDDILPRSNDPEWDDKVDERLLWRGSSTGIFHSKKTRWQNSHRISLLRVANDLKGTMAILSPKTSNTEPVGEPIEVRKARLNPGIMDVAFAGDPIMCDPETCSHLMKIFPWRRRQSVQEAGDYKYVIDVDGNGWSGRFKRLITSNSLVFKATIYPEWYIDRIAPWVHYVPIQLDLSDLHDALVFFRGDASGVGAHEDLARKIALVGRNWSKTFWRREDMVAYFFRLMLEYARLMSEDREAMSYIG